MGELLDRHLDAISAQMGGYLRGFDVETIHLGTADRFAREFRKVLGLPMLQAPGAAGKISYSEAVQSYHAPQIETAALDPVSTLVRGLGGPSPLAADDDRMIPLQTLQSDLGRLLRVPAMRFYMHVQDSGRFFARLDEISKEGSFALARGPRESSLECPVCAEALVQQDSASLECPVCKQQFETFYTLPMVAGVLAIVSYEMLRATVALDLVESYQEEAEIVPLA